MDEDFQAISAYLESEAELRERLREEVAKFDQKVRSMQGMLNKIHATPTDQMGRLVASVHTTLGGCRENTRAIADLVPPNHYWKWKEIWQKTLQAAVFVVVLCRYLEDGSLIMLADVSKELGIAPEWKDRFTLPAEDYLHGLVSLVNELSRLAVNAVTLGDFDAPFRISVFVKDLFAGFSLLNLKNDSLRRRFDSLKYDVKKIEEVVYDVSLRKLNTPTTGATPQSNRA